VLAPPHAYPVPAQRHSGAFAGIEPWRPPNYNEADVSDKPAWLRAIPPMDATAQARNDDVRQKQLETLLAVDEVVQTILTALEETGRLTDTLIVFTSDNGKGWGEHRWTQKQVAYEESIRVPFVVRYDAMGLAPRTDPHLVANIDVAPTFDELAGLPTDGIDGQSLLTLLPQPGAAWRSDFLVEHLGGDKPPTFCAVRNEGFTYVDFGAEAELYDLALDPYQLQNGVGDLAYAETLAGMRGSLRLLCQPPPPDFVLPSATVTLDLAPPASTTETTATFAFTASETGTTFTCTLDGVATGCVSPMTYTGLSAGSHTFSVEVIDGAGGLGSTASWAWVVTPIGPTVTVSDFAFSPAVVSQALGYAVSWSISGPSPHRIADNSGLGLYDSGPLGAGASYVRAFESGGAWKYVCLINPSMTGTVQVIPTASPSSGTQTTEFTVTWAVAPPPAGLAYDVQIRRPGGNWVAWKFNQSALSATFVPDAGAGSYAFRAPDPQPGHRQGHRLVAAGPDQGHRRLTNRLIITPRRRSRSGRDQARAPPTQTWSTESWPGRYVIIAGLTADKGTHAADCRLTRRPRTTGFQVFARSGLIPRSTSACPIWR